MLKPDLAWPAYGYGSAGQQITSVAIDSAGILYSLDRGGRLWDQRNASKVISEPVLRKWTADGVLLDELGADLFVMPHSVTTCTDGAVIVTDIGLHQVVKLSHDGTVEWELGTSRIASDEIDCFNLPTDVALAQDGAVFVADGYGNARILKFTNAATPDLIWGSKGEEVGQFQLPHSLDIDDDGQIYVADRENARVQVFDADGAFISVLQGDKIGKPFAVCHHNNFLYIADCGYPTDKTAAIVIVDLQTKLVLRVGKFGTDLGDLVGPHSLTVDDSGAVYVADAVAGLLKFIPEGNYNG